MVNKLLKKHIYLSKLSLIIRNENPLYFFSNCTIFPCPYENEMIIIKSIFVGPPQHWGVCSVHPGRSGHGLREDHAAQVQPGTIT